MERWASRRSAAVPALGAVRYLLFYPRGPRFGGCCSHMDKLVSRMYSLGTETAALALRRVPGPVLYSLAPLDV